MKTLLISQKTTFLSILIVGYLCLLNVTYGQKNDLLQKASTLKYSDPDEAIKIGKYQLKSSESANYRALELLMISDAYRIKGDYSNAIHSVFEASSLNSKKTKTTITVNLLKARLLWILFLDDQARRYVNKAEKLTEKITPEQEKLKAKIAVSLEKLRLDFPKQTGNKALNAVDSLARLFKSAKITDKDLKLNLDLTKVWVSSNNTESQYPASYFKIHLAALAKKHEPNFYAQALFNNGLSELLIKQKKFKAARDTLLVALKVAKKLDNQFLLRDINQNLAVAALALNNQNAHKTYNQTFRQLSKEVEKTEQEAVNLTYNLISKEEQQTLKSKKSNLSTYRNTAVVVFCVVLLICFVFWFKFYLVKRRYTEIFNYLEVGKNVVAKSKPKSAIKKTTIPEEKKKSILKKLQRFEESTKFTSNDMSLAVLAGHLDTNTKYLSEIINTHYHDNFKTYINKLRIRFIIEKLKTDPNYSYYKISFLAEKSGFSSHSSFATVFKSIVGMPPAAFINLLKEDREKTGKN